MERSQDFKLYSMMTEFKKFYSDASGTRYQNEVAASMSTAVRAELQFIV